MYFFHQRGESKEVFAKKCGITWALRIVRKLDKSRIKEKVTGLEPTTEPGSIVLKKQEENPGKT